MPSILSSIFSGESARVVLSLLLIGGCLLATRAWQRQLGQSERPNPAQRTRLVWAKNIVWLFGVAALITLWGTKLAGFALSVAAVAGAMLIVSKEFVLCLHGYLLLGMTRLYRVGDFIEVGDFAGRVIDIDPLTTTLAETGSTHQMSGKTVAFPHSILLTTAVRNTSATGIYLVNLLRLAVPQNTDIDHAEACALAAAEQATQSWQASAGRYFEQLESRSFIDLPSARPKVLWESTDPKALHITIRFACPAEQRVAVEQEIFRRFWRNLQISASRETDDS